MKTWREERTKIVGNIYTMEGGEDTDTRGSILCSKMMLLVGQLQSPMVYLVFPLKNLSCFPFMFQS